jgi:hypothetical protein
MENDLILIEKCQFCDEVVPDRLVAECCDKRKEELMPALWTWYDYK